MLIQYLPTLTSPFHVGALTCFVISIVVRSGRVRYYDMMLRDWNCCTHNPHFFNCRCAPLKHLLTWIYSADNDSNHARLTNIRGIIIGRTHKKFLPHYTRLLIHLPVTDEYVTIQHISLLTCWNRFTRNPPFYYCLLLHTFKNKIHFLQRRRQRLQPCEVNEHLGLLDERRNFFCRATPDYWCICLRPMNIRLSNTFPCLCAEFFVHANPAFSLSLRTFKNQIYWLESPAATTAPTTQG